LESTARRVQGAEPAEVPKKAGGLPMPPLLPQQEVRINSRG
jgi:hypothetical protein